MDCTSLDVPDEFYSDVCSSGPSCRCKRAPFAYRDKQTDHETKLSYIGASLNNTQAQTWVPNALALMQAVINPLFCSASDTFQARKPLLVGSSAISFIGAAIAPGSKDIYRLIGATILIGVGFSSVGLACTVPSEILPRKWRPSKS